MPQKNIVALSKSDEIKTLFKRIAPGIFGAGIYQINMMVDTILVSLVGSGAISWLYYANRLQQLPLGVVGAAIGVALLPILSRQLKSAQNDEAKKTQDKAVEFGIMLSVPAAAAMIVLAEPVVNILFQHGKFGVFQTLMTSRAVMAYALGLPLYVMVKALAPNFFARLDTKTPVKYSAVVLLANLLFSVILMQFFGHIGIAFATTLAAFVSLGLYIRGLKKRGFWIFSSVLKIRILKIFLCSIVMGFFLQAQLWGLSLIFGDWLKFSFVVKAGILGVISAAALAVLTIMFKITGIIDVFSYLKNFYYQRRKK
ncbi:MAG: polysaccharide biosynthesis C-terminal domain-containing protein [Alphaproteobacteria bacterium]|nr:polysaccharide biosynthesis C-terminal domain-containing protein [Alphaproteobacteria bacterium]